MRESRLNVGMMIETEDVLIVFSFFDSALTEWIRSCLAGSEYRKAQDLRFWFRRQVDACRKAKRLNHNAEAHRE